jgi:hypothetical protein
LWKERVGKILCTSPNLNTWLKRNWSYKAEARLTIILCAAK